MYPHERSLVKRLESKPFALVGVNSDTNKDKLRQALDKEHITWRSWWDGSKSGPIDTTWNIHAWPTIYLIDSKGVIRYKDVTGKELEEAIDRLLTEQQTRRTP